MTPPVAEKFLRDSLVSRHPMDEPWTPWQEAVFCILNEMDAARKLLAVSTKK